MSKMKKFVKIINYDFETIKREYNLIIATMMCNVYYKLMNINLNIFSCSSCVLWCVDLLIFL